MWSSIPQPFRHLAPLTFRIGFLEASLGQFADALFSWTRENFERVDMVPIESASLESLRKLEPLCTPPRRELLLATYSSWTAYFDNGVQGGDPFAPISFLAQRLKCRGLIAAIRPHTIKMKAGRETGMSGAVQLELFGPERKEFLNYERSISVAYESGWEFNATGTVQPFEDTKRYQARRIRDRFTPEMLKEYCAALGVRPWDVDFYSSEAVLLSIDRRMPAAPREHSLEEARQRLGISDG